jgi:hypothetical protein
MRRLQKLRRWPTSDVVFHMARHLSGSAKDWVNANILHDNDNTPTPEDFIAALERQYDQSYVANAKMRRLFQGSSVRDYNAQFSALRCQMSRDIGDGPLSESAFFFCIYTVSGGSSTPSSSYTRSLRSPRLCPQPCSLNLRFYLAAETINCDARPTLRSLSPVIPVRRFYRYPVSHISIFVPRARDYFHCILSQRYHAIPSHSNRLYKWMMSRITRFTNSRVSSYKDPTPVHAASVGVLLVIVPASYCHSKYFCKRSD